MKKIYVLGPLVGLLVFGGFHWRHSRLHELRLAETKRLEELTKKQKQAEQAASRTQAEEQARIAIAKRNEERAEKEKIEEAQKRMRAELEQRRNTAAEQVWRLRPQLDRLRSELDTVKAGVARCEERKRELQIEQEFLAQHVKETVANRDVIYQLLEKLEAAERTRAAATPAARPTSTGKG